LSELNNSKEWFLSGEFSIFLPPIGPQQIEFNANRATEPATLIGWFVDDWEIVRCAVIDDDGYAIEADEFDLLKGANCNLGVGIVAARGTK